MKNSFFAIIVGSAFIFAAHLSLKAQVAQGGIYKMEQTVIAAGGWILTYLQKREIMKQKINFAPEISRAVFLLTLIVCAASASARAQTVVPRVCVEDLSQRGAVRLTSGAAIGDNQISVDAAVPANSILTINAGASNEEENLTVASVSGGGNTYTLTLGGNLTKTHAANEPVQFNFSQIEAFWGYNNSGAQRVIPRGILANNYFSPAPTTYQQQIVNFAAGIRENAFSIRFNPTATPRLTWNLDGSAATAAADAPRCAKITYQGRLTTNGAAASGNYDLQFVVYDSPTGGAAQSDVVSAANVAVQNGVFTANLNFYSSFNGNQKARFIEIRVRPASQNQNDPYTILAPRQPLTDVPFAVNAQKAFDVQLIQTSGAPPATDCNAASKYGQMRVDAANLKLWICTASGWKSTALQ